MSKAKGTRWELECQKMLESEGYWVTKAGGSLGVFDLVATGTKATLYIQCKCNDWAGPSERKAMTRLPSVKRDDVYIEVWRKDDYKPSPRIMFYDPRYMEWHIAEQASNYWQSIRARLKEPK